MNNRGQTLIIFVILIPIIITMAALVVDIGKMNYEKERYRGIIENSIEEYFESNQISDVKEILTLNGIPEDAYQITTQENLIEIHLTTSVDSIFAKLINIDEYQIDLDYIGTKESDRVIINKKE